MLLGFPSSSSAVVEDSRIKVIKRTEQNLLGTKQNLEYFWLMGWISKEQFKQRIYELLRAFDYIQLQLKQLEKEGI